MKLLSDTELARLIEEAGAPDLTGTRYSMVRSVASGGMGQIYLVRDSELGREVALKVMNFPEVTEELAGRMLREARIIARLEHPGIVPVHDVGRLPDGRIFFTMKYVQGHRLDEYINEKLTVAELVRCFLPMSEAVAFAHSKGVIHRDLKPENIMVGPFGEVLVMDWGIAKFGQDDSADGTQRAPISKESDISDETRANSDGLCGTDGHQVVTGAGAVLGTPQFMSPEQAAGNVPEIGKPSDVYGLGAVLYYMLTGQPPQSDRGSVHWGTGREAIPTPLRAICEKCLAADPQSRYPSAAELSADIRNFLDEQAVSAYTESLLERMARWVSKNRFLVILVAAYMLMRLLVLFFSHR